MNLVKNNCLLLLTLLLGFLGFLDASYLTILHYKNSIPPCSIAHGCETVLTSKFATIGKLPIALLGTIYYLTVMLLVGVFWQTNKRLSLKLLLIVTALALLISFVLVYLQGFVLHDFCQYCLLSEGINVGLFAVIGIKNVQSYNLKNE